MINAASTDSRFAEFSKMLPALKSRMSEIGNGVRISDRYSTPISILSNERNTNGNGHFVKNLCLVI